MFNMHAAEQRLNHNSRLVCTNYVAEQVLWILHKRETHIN